MICIKKEGIKICDQAVEEECIDCVTGSRERVPRLNGTELIDYVLRSNSQLEELSNIVEGLIELLEKSKLGVANKRLLLSLLKRLCLLESDMGYTGSTVASNLLLNEGSNATTEGQELSLLQSFTSEN